MGILFQIIEYGCSNHRTGVLKKPILLLTPNIAVFHLHQNILLDQSHHHRAKDISF